jgi:hypothetical protein
MITGSEVGKPGCCSLATGEPEEEEEEEPLMISMDCEAVPDCEVIPRSNDAEDEDEDDDDDRKDLLGSNITALVCTS